MITSLFRKNPRTVNEYLIMLIRKPKILFQLDFYRNHQVDFQISRQVFLKGFGIKVDNPKGFVISLSFNSEKDQNEQNLERFKASYLLDNAVEKDFLGKTYFLKCNDNIEEITTLINHIQTKVYNYDKDTVYGFTYSKH